MPDLQQVRRWADDAETLAEAYRGPRAGDEGYVMNGEDWVLLNALAEELRTYANDLQMEHS